MPISEHMAAADNPFNPNPKKKVGKFNGFWMDHAVWALVHEDINELERCYKTFAPVADINMRVGYGDTLPGLWSDNMGLQLFWRQGDSLMHLAVRNRKDPKFVKKIIELGADVTMKSGGDSKLVREMDPDRFYDFLHPKKKKKEVVKDANKAKKKVFR